MLRDTTAAIAIATTIMIALYAMLFMMHLIYTVPKKWPPPIGVFYGPCIMSIIAGIKYVILKKRNRV